jgi:hypothetical protein
MPAEQYKHLQGESKRARLVSFAVKPSPANSLLAYFTAYDFEHCDHVTRSRFVHRFSSRLRNPAERFAHQFRLDPDRRFEVGSDGPNLTNLARYQPFLSGANQLYNQPTSPVLYQPPSKTNSVS